MKYKGGEKRPCNIIVIIVEKLSQAINIKKAKDYVRIASE